MRAGLLSKLIRRLLVRSVPSIALSILFAAASPIVLCNQPRTATMVVFLNDPAVGTHVSLTLDFEPRSVDELQLAVADALGCNLEDVRIDRFDQPAETEPADPQSEEATVGEKDGALTDSSGFYWQLGGRPTNALLTDAAFVEGRIDPGPLLRLLGSQGADLLRLSVMHPQRGFSYCSEGESPTLVSELECHFYSIPTESEGVEAITIAYGYRSADVIRVSLPILLVMVTPMAAMLIVRRRSLSRNANAITVWFRLWRAAPLLAIGVWVSWVAVASLPGTSQLLDLLLPDLTASVRVGIYISLYLIPPIWTISVCNALLLSVNMHARGLEYTWVDIGRQAFLGEGAGLVSLVFVWMGISTLFESPQNGVLWLGAAFATAILIGTLRKRALSLTPHALTVGELRDRVFALAHNAKVKLQQVYILPGGKIRMANAMAQQGNNVILTDQLVEHLNKRQVDAIIAHEVAHLKRGHPRALGWVFVGVFLVIGGSTPVIQLLISWLPALPIGTVFGFLAFFFMSRRFEYKADAEAVALTGDPEGLISALAALSRISLMPMHWGKWNESVLTHPSTAKRLEAIARRYAVPTERLSAIVAETSEQVGECYGLPPAIVEGGQCFSTSFKRGAANKVAWTLLSITILTPALVATLAELSGGSAAIKLAIYIGGIAATFLAYLIAANFVPVWGSKRLEEGLRIRLKSQDIDVKRGSGMFVGFSPAPEPRFYENNYAWDIGFLFMDGDRVCYVGEQTRFAIRKDQIVEMRLGPGAIGWWTSEYVFVSWFDSEQGERLTFNVFPYSGRSLREASRKVKELFLLLEEWRHRAASTLDRIPELAALSRPSIGAVTSISPREALSFGKFLNGLIVTELIAIGICLAFGLSLNPLNDPGGWYVLFVAALVSILQVIPFWRHR